MAKPFGFRHNHRAAETSWAREPSICEPQKCAALRWFPFDALPDAIPSYERVVLDGLARGDLPTFTSFGFTPA